MWVNVNLPNPQRGWTGSVLILEEAEPRYKALVGVWPPGDGRHFQGGGTPLGGGGHGQGVASFPQMVADMVKRLAHSTRWWQQWRAWARTVAKHLTLGAPLYYNLILRNKLHPTVAQSLFSLWSIVTFTIKYISFNITKNGINLIEIFKHFQQDHFYW